MSMRYLDRAEVIAINRHLCRLQRQACAVLSIEALTEAVQRPALCIDGYEPFPEIWEKAAVLMDSLLKGKAFLHANVLTGFLAADLMLRSNGYLLSSQAEDKEWITSVSLHQVTILQIAEWLRGRVQG